MFEVFGFRRILSVESVERCLRDSGLVPLTSSEFDRFPVPCLFMDKIFDFKSEKWLCLKNKTAFRRSFNVFRLVSLFSLPKYHNEDVYSLETKRK